MKKLLFIILMLWGVAEAQTITYTPMTAAGYRFKHLLADSGFNLPFGDTTLKRGTTRPGSIVCNTADSLVYIWNGLRYELLGGVTQNYVSNYVDSSVLVIQYYIDSSMYVTNNYTGGINKILNGGSVVWDSLFCFHNTTLVYNIGIQIDTADASTFCITGLNSSYDQYFRIYADTLGNIGYILGGQNPTEFPDIDQDSQILLATYFVAANDSTPTGLSKENIYLEGNEWTVSGSARYNPLWTSYPFAGIYSLHDSLNTARSNIDFVDSNSTHSAGDYTYLTYEHRLGATFAANQSLQFQWMNNNSAVSSIVTVFTGNYGYTRTISGAYQLVAIPLSAWTFSNSTFNKLRIIVGNINTNFFDLDNITLQTGGYNTATVGVNTFQGGDSTIPARSGNVRMLITDDIWSARSIDTNYNASKYYIYNSKGIAIDSVTTLKKNVVGTGNTTIIESNDTIYVNSTGGSTIDTTSLSNRIDLKLSTATAASTYQPLITTSAQVLTASGSTAFTFTSVPASYNDYIIFRNGVKITNTVDYTTSGNIVTIPAIITGDEVSFQRIK